MADKIAEWAEAMLRLRGEMAAWIKQSMALNRQIPWSGGHDEGTFLGSWFGYYLLTGDGRVADFLRWMRDGWLDWAAKNFHHGYYAKGEAHHQPETFLIFLTRMLHLDPDHRPTIEAMDHMAHHVGNWVEGIPEWYDWEKRRFRSWRLGTREVAARPPEDYENSDHFRLAEILLATYLANGDGRYLDFCKQYCDKWCDAILAEEGRIPGALLPTNDFRAYPEGRVKSARGDPKEGVEMHVAGCSIDFLMDMFLLTEGERYIASVKKMMPYLIEAIADPYSEPPGSLYGRYRRMTGDTALDARAMEIMAAMPEAEDDQPLLMMVDTTPLPHPMGIGRRKDDLRWGRRRGDGSIAEETGPSPASLFLAWQISGSDAYLARALERAADRLAQARQHLQDGRRHGCAGGTISALAGGHGRCPGIGHVTATLYPAAFGGHRFCNAELPEVRYFTKGALGLPDRVASLRLPGELCVTFCNAGDEPARITIALEPDRPGLHGLARPADGVQVQVEVLPQETNTVRLE
ncbi:MAG: hypothetical protein AB1696_27600 [Planctomycetota bacterium]